MREWAKGKGKQAKSKIAASVRAVSGKLAAKHDGGGGDTSPRGPFSASGSDGAHNEPGNSGGSGRTRGRRGASMYGGGGGGATSLAGDTERHSTGNASQRSLERSGNKAKSPSRSPRRRSITFGNSNSLL